MARGRRQESQDANMGDLSGDAQDGGSADEAVEGGQDENYDYFQASRPLDEDEMRAEEEGERLIDDDEGDGFVVGMKDDERERAAFLAAGLDADDVDTSLIDDDDDAGGIDDEAKARRAAERHLRARDRLKKQRKGGKQDIWSSFLDDDDDIAAEVAQLRERVQQRRRHQRSTATDGEQINLRDLQQAKNLLSESNPRLVSFDEQQQQAVDTLFRYFLYNFNITTYKRHNGIIINNDDNVNPYYLEKIQKMILEDRTSLHIDTRHLLFFSDVLILWLEIFPSSILSIMNDTITIEASTSCPSLYSSRVCNVIIVEWPYKQELRHLRCNNLNTMICVTGVVTRRSAVLPRMRLLYIKCAHCYSTVSEAPLQLTDTQTKINFPNRCPQCQGSRFIVDRLRTTYADVQRIVIQEPPSKCPPGRPPRQREVLLFGDLVDCVVPGEEVEIVGIYNTKYNINLNIKNGFPILGTEILANSIISKKDIYINNNNDDDIHNIILLSKQNNIRERIIASIAPTLCGSIQVKTAIAYALFGGVPKGRHHINNNNNINNNNIINNNNNNNNNSIDPMNSNTKAAQGQHVIRGDINVLLLGDPGLGKSQALQYVARTFPRSVSTTGKGASAAGLTAGVRRDAYTGEWCLEGGALVLADQGICLIDEFDKMTDKDRVSIHEAMEQQSISISKAGIVTTLRARCSVIAAANPKFGRYIPSYTFKENVDLSDPILSRFDLICVLRDIPDADDDYFLAEYVLSNHQLNHPTVTHIDDYNKKILDLESTMFGCNAHEPIDQQLLQKYILYARANCHPVLDPSLPTLASKLSTFYAKLRKRAFATGGLPMTLRHVEALLRIAEANAKMRLSPIVTSLDVDYAIAAIFTSFIASQKYAVQQRLSKEFARYRALAAGGWSTLSALLRRQMQQQLQRITLRRVGGDDDDCALLEQNDIDKARRISLDSFMQLAAQNKFSAYQVENWMASNHFSSNFAVLQEGGQKILVSSNWHRTSQ